MPIDPASSSTSTTGTSASTAVTGVSTAPETSLDKDGFLKLLTAQLRNQDPQSTQDPSQYFQTISQMTVVEQLTNLAASQAEQNATAMIGKTVTYRTKDNDLVSGTLESVQLGTGGKPTTLTIDGRPGIKAEMLTEVK